MVLVRRKGVAVVDGKKGILLVAGRSPRFHLPGGGADRGESRQSASKRELWEETGLYALFSKYLFSHRGGVWRGYSGKRVYNRTKVFKLFAVGFARPRNEIKRIHWWTPESTVDITSSTKKVLKKYLKMKYKS